MADILKMNLMAAVLILLAIGLSRVLKNRYSVRWKYGVWLVTAFFLLLSPALAAGTSLVEMQIPEKIYRVEEEPDRGAARVREMESGEGGSYETPVSGSNPAFPVAGDPETPRIVFSVELFLEVFQMIWIIGIAFGVIYYGMRRAVVSQGLKQWRKNKIPYSTEQIYRRVCRQLGIRKRPGLYLHPDISSPLLFGLFGACLYLPEKDYTPEELELIFVHEINHYKHKDLWYKMVLLAARIYCWFNPALILMFREADRDLESLCDSRVIAYMEGREKRIAYGKLLLRAASETDDLYKVTAGLNDGVTKFQDRLAYMMRADRLKRGIPLALLLSALLVVSNGLVGCSLEPADTLTETSSHRDPMAEFTPVPTKYKLYERTYCDSIAYGALDNPPEYFYEIDISDITDTSFDFTLVHRKWVPEPYISEDVFSGTAVFVGDGTVARYKDETHDLTFRFPDTYHALPDVVSMRISGFEPIEGVSFACSSIEGHEFS